MSMNAAVHSVSRLVFSVPELDEAQRFYERKGMVPDGARQSRTLAPGETLAEIRYRKEVSHE